MASRAIQQPEPMGTGMHNDRSHWQTHTFVLSRARQVLLGAPSSIGLSLSSQNVRTSKGLLGDGILAHLDPVFAQQREDMLGLISRILIPPYLRKYGGI